MPFSKAFTGLQIEASGSFLFLSQVVSEHEVAAKRVPESIEHVKSLNAEMHSLRQQIQAEDLAHKEAVINWNKTLVQMKQVLFCDFSIKKCFLIIPSSWIHYTYSMCFTFE